MLQNSFSFCASPSTGPLQFSLGMGAYDNPLFLLFLLLSTTTTSASLLASPPPLPAPPISVPDKSPLRPSLAVVIGVLTTMFSVTFLLLLYAKHCRRRMGGGSSGGYNTRGGPHISIDDRKHSGIDRTLIELLPVFRFGALSGQKDGLECAVCLNQFDPIDVLRLLPKCKHAFHVECVDTWLDAHSTCPLCRYQVDPEDILLVQDPKIQHQLEEPHEQEPPEFVGRRISGRHSSAGEIGSTGFVRISIDSAAATGVGSHRRSLDSISYNGSKSKRKKKKNEEAAPPLSAERQRKDGLLLAEATEEERRSFDRRFEHRIIVSGAGVGVGGTQYRWSDVQPSDLLYLRTEMILSDSRRLSGVTGSRPSVTRQKSSNKINTDASWSINNGGGGIINEENNGWWQWQRWRRRERESGRSVINTTRSVSEITGLSRFGGVSNEGGADGAVVSRWLAWRSQPAVSHPGRPSTASNSSLS